MQYLRRQNVCVNFPLHQWLLLVIWNILHCSDLMLRQMLSALPQYSFTHVMFLSNVCQLLCNLHAISIEMPKGSEVTQSKKSNMSVNLITAHIQCRDKCIHWGDSLIGSGTLCLVVPEDSLYNLHIPYDLYSLVLDLRKK